MDREILQRFDDSATVAALKPTRVGVTICSLRAHRLRRVFTHRLRRGLTGRAAGSPAALRAHGLLRGFTGALQGRPVNP